MRETRRLRETDTCCRTACCARFSAVALAADRAGCRHAGVAAVLGDDGYLHGRGRLRGRGCLHDRRCLRGPNRRNARAGDRPCSADRGFRTASGCCGRGRGHGYGYDYGYDYGYGYGATGARPGPVRRRGAERRS